jgi:hypothetical protein
MVSLEGKWTGVYSENHVVLPQVSFNRLEVFQKAGFPSNDIPMTFMIDYPKREMKKS